MIQKIINTLKYRRNFRQTYKELAKLSTRELEDIGINRCMITRLAMEHARKVTSWKNFGTDLPHTYKYTHTIVF